ERIAEEESFVLYDFELIDLELITRSMCWARTDDAPGLRVGLVGVGRGQLARSSAGGAAVFLHRCDDWTTVDHRRTVVAGDRCRLGPRPALWSSFGVSGVFVVSVGATVGLLSGTSSVLGWFSASGALVWFVLVGILVGPVLAGDESPVVVVVNVIFVGVL